MRSVSERKEAERRAARSVEAAATSPPTKSVKLDYDIVYVRAPRRGDEVGTNWADLQPALHGCRRRPDALASRRQGGSSGRGRQGIGRRPDGLVRWRVGLLLTLSRPEGGDDHRRSRRPVPTSSRSTSRRGRIVRLTHQQFTPNTGAGNWSKDFRTPEPGKNSIDYGVFNMGPCPLPGGKVVFTSNRNGFRPPKRLPQTMQLFVMDDDGVECRVHRPPEPGDGAAPGGPDGRPRDLQLARIAGAAHVNLVGPVEHPSRRHATGGRSSARSCRAKARTRFTSRRNCPTARSWPRSITTRPAAASAGSSSCRFRAGRRPVVWTRLHGRPAQSAAARRTPRRRPAAHAPAPVQSARHRGLDALRPDR